jgi:hypothetical protein
MTSDTEIQPATAPATTPSDIPAGNASAATSPAGDEQDQPCTDCLPRSHKDDHPFTGCGCGSCDSESIEILCQAEGIRARAQYDETNKDAPSPQQYEATRLAYGQSRYTVGPRLEQLGAKLADSMHEIRCRIDDRDKIDCLERAWSRLSKRLRRCRVRGCCVENYSFEPELFECGVDQLKCQIARFEYVTWRADTCFQRLALEPTLLVQRVDDVTAEISAIYLALHPDQAPAGLATPKPAASVTLGAAGDAANAEGDQTASGGAADTTAGTTGAKAGAAGGSGPETPPAPVPTDLIHLYAMGLVAEYHLDDIWWGYGDGDAFVECLCRAMKVSMAGHRALAALYGEVRVREARWEERNNCCRRLKENSTSEIITGYVRCIQSDVGDDDGDDEIEVEVDVNVANEEVDVAVEIDDGDDDYYDDDDEEEEPEPAPRRRRPVERQNEPPRRGAGQRGAESGRTGERSQAARSRPSR